MTEALMGPTASKRHQIDIIITCDKDKDVASLPFSLWLRIQNYETETRDFTFWIEYVCVHVCACKKC